jgi:hypothetical protein
MKPLLKWSLLGVGVVVVGVGAGLSYMAGSPKDAVEMVRYALPYMHLGDLKVGSAAPDSTLVALDGETRFHVRDRIGGKPLVLVFGSFT